MDPSDVSKKTHLSRLSTTVRDVYLSTKIGDATAPLQPNQIFMLNARDASDSSDRRMACAGVESLLGLALWSSSLYRD